MKSDKQQAIELIDQMPDTVSAETIITELQFKITMLRRGADAEREAGMIPQAEAQRRLEKWLKSSGT